MILGLVVHPILHTPVHPYCQAYHQFIEKIGNSKKGVVKTTRWTVVGGNVFFVMETTCRTNVGLF